MSYFSYLPKVEYNITKSKYLDTSTAVNIFVRNLIKQNVIDKGIQFDQHTIGDTERPDITSYMLYGNVKYDWVIFLANRMFNPYFDWPLSSQDFRKLLQSKYGSAERARKIIHEYHQIIQAKTDTEKEIKVVVDYETWNVLSDTVRSRITKYDHEFQINERNRNIKVIDLQYIESIFKEAQSKRYG
jgi:hypothetical protein